MEILNFSKMVQTMFRMCRSEEFVEMALDNVFYSQTIHIHILF